ncbi:MAG: PAS domain S-box protein, partial [Leptolyngbyaceae cyanobacterium MAG.088]|nr:PAS domain S-box protein [Leptolyngbyaceae cyanobacterium MAG.088]
AVPELSGSAAQNRFNLIFGKFIRVFTSPTHPLVIFLDDLQWVDSASLNLFKLLVDDESAYLLLLGAYRDNEVLPTHPLMLMVNEIQHLGATLNTLTLGPLRENDIDHLVADTLHDAIELARPLSQLVHQKTQGNPFFAIQFLQGLYSDGWITFNQETDSWQYDLPQVRQLALTDNVVALMVERLCQLPTATQEVLKLSACIGNHFDLQTLAVVCECSQAEAAVNLWPLLQMGLIVPADNAYKFLQGELENDDPTDATTDEIKISYRFLHDYVQQSAYALIPQEQKSQIHYHLGQLLTCEISTESQELRIFELVTHLNHGADHIMDQHFRDDVAQLNLKACQKAKRTIAYQAGYEYATMGLSWLGAGAWERQYDLSLQLYNFAAEFAWLVGNLETMDSYITTILKQSQSLLDKIPAFCLRIQADTSQMQFAEALITAQQVFELLGVVLPSTATLDDVPIMVSDIEQLLFEIGISELSNLPVMDQQSDIAVIQIISQVIPAAYICGSPLFPIIVILGVTLLVRGGNSPLSAYIYANYAYILSNYYQKIEASEEFGRLALRLANKPDAKSVRPQVYVMLALYMQHRKSPLRETLDLARQGYVFAQEVGNQEWAGYSAYAFCANGFASTQNLVNLEKLTQDYCVSLGKLSQIAPANWCQIYRQTILNLTNPSPQQQKIFFDNPDQEAEFLTGLHAAEDLLGLYHFHLCKLIISYLFEDIASAYAHALEARARLDVAQGTVGLPVFYFYDSLVLLRQLTKVDIDSKEGKEKLQQVENNQDKLQQNWARYAPVNYQHKFNLVQAEKLGVLGERWAALELYDEAIAEAKAHGYLQEEALANELAAKFYLGWHKEKIAAGYMQDAHHGYLRWRANAKTDDLEQRYPHLLQPILRAAYPVDPLETLANVAKVSLSIHSSTTSTSSSINAQLDFTAILKSSQLLSEKVQLDELLTHLSQLMLQNSGADELAIVLPNDNNEWQVRCITNLGTTQLLAESLTNYSNLPIQLIQYTKNTQEVIAIDGLDNELPIIDAYLQHHHPRSILCLPILYQGNLRGLLYLQNQSIAGVFSRDRILVLNFLCSQAAIALENARLFKQQQQSAQELVLKQNHLEALLNNIPHIAWIKDDQSRFIAVNEPFAQACCTSAEDLVGKTDFDIWPADLAQSYRNDDAQVLKSAKREVFEEQVACADGTLRWFETTKTPFTDSQGTFVGTVGIAADITDRKQAEGLLTDYNQDLGQQVKQRTQDLKQAELALQNLVTGTAALTGPDFFPALVQHIAVALNASHTFVTEVIEGDQLRYLAAWGDGQHLPTAIIDVEGTTCAIAIREGVYHCERDVIACFPQTPILAPMGVESYMGVALHNRQGEALGTLCIFSRQPIANPERSQEILRVFAARAAAELERQRAEQAMEQLNRDLEIRVRDRTAQLAASEQRLQTLFNEAADAVFLKSEETIIDCNQAAVDLLRYTSKEELLTLRTDQISPERQPDGQLSRVKAKAMSQEALQRCSLRFEWVHQRADGENFWAEITLASIRYQEETILHCIVRDISDRKQLEQEQARLTAVLEATPDFIGIANVQGEILWHNHAFRQIRPELGKPEDHIHLSVCHPHEINELFEHQAFPEAIENGLWSGETILLDKDGREIPVSQVIIAHKSASGEVESFSTVMRDIRAIKQTE